MVDHHLPSKFQSKLDSTDTYSAYIDHAASAQVPRSAGYRSPDRATRSAGNETYDATPESSGLRQEGPHRMPRLNLQDIQSKKDAVEDIRLSLDRLIQQGRNSERAKATVKLVDGEEAVKQERRRLQEEITRVRRVLLNAEEMARVAEKTSTPLLTLIDPVGREYLLPYNQCRSFEVMEKLIKKIFRSDEILARPIARGDYKFTSIDGDPITRDGWDSAIQPGRTIMIHIKKKAQSQKLEKASTKPDQPVEAEKSTAQVDVINFEDLGNQQAQDHRVNDISDSSA
ncbi:hypothetical protein AtubIFM55763_000994 [Aspergillus tubingensis]|nr:hypothetical protein AtubIFM55763_000994 [Aspergillus tubingensis]